MIVYHRYPRDSRGIGRTAGMMERHAPAHVQFTNHERGAQVVVIHVHGERDAVRRTVTHARQNGRRYAIVQHVLKSSQKPDAKEWQDIWAGAEVVWSAYDLRAICKQDGASLGAPFYHAPYGGDANVFSAPLTYPRRFVLGTNGTALNTESMWECYHAGLSVNRPQFHLGTAIPAMDGLVEVRDGISDAEVAQYWGQCEFVSGLRHIEGFELPAVEGLLCGARPILYDAPHYRQWYDPWGVFIPPHEGRNDRRRAIAAVLRGGARPVSAEEREAAARFFDWKPLVAGFWRHLA